MITQREYDIRQIESEQKIRSLFEEWRTSFLKGRLVDQQSQQGQYPQQQQAGPLQPPPGQAPPVQQPGPPPRGR